MRPRAPRRHTATRWKRRRRGSRAAVDRWRSACRSTGHHPSPPSPPTPSGRTPCPRCSLGLAAPGAQGRQRRERMQAKAPSPHPHSPARPPRRVCAPFPIATTRGNEWPAAPRRLTVSPERLLRAAERVHAERAAVGPGPGPVGPRGPARRGGGGCEAAHPAAGQQAREENLPRACHVRSCRVAVGLASARRGGPQPGFQRGVIPGGAQPAERPGEETAVYKLCTFQTTKRHAGARQETPWRSSFQDPTH